MAYIVMMIFIFPWFTGEGLASTVTSGAKRFILDNGLRVILKEDRSAPAVSIQAWVRTGSGNETEEEAGITHLIEHMIFKGTPSRGTGEIARSIESYGGEINAYTTLDRTVYKVEIAGEHFNKALDILMDVLQYSLFDPEDLSREKEVILEEYRRSLDIPQRQFTKAMNKLSYTAHPYRRPVIGYESTIMSFNRHEILNYMAKWYTSDNIVIVAVGDFDSDNALERIRSLAADLPSRIGHRSMPGFIEPAQSYPRTLVLKERVQQLYLNILWHSVSLNHPHVPALDLLEVIFGYGKSSRLYKRLKMEKNLVHEVFAYSNTRLDNGQFLVGASLDPENFQTVAGVIADEIKRVKTETVSTMELDRAKRIVKAHFLFDMEDMEGQADSLAFFETMAGDMKKADEYLESIIDVGPEEILEVAKKYMIPEKICMGIMIPQDCKAELADREVMELFSDSVAKRDLSVRREAEDARDGVRYTLWNGMKIIIKENHRLPLVSIRVAMLGGTRMENRENAGVSNFVSKMVIRGTDTRNALEIAGTVESWPADLESFSGRNSFGISAKFLGRDMVHGMELLADVILNPSFPDAEIEKVRQDILKDIESRKESPFEQLTDLFHETLYTQHPYALPAPGSKQSITGMKREDLLRWYKSFSFPSNIVISAVGDIREKELISLIKELFMDFDARQVRLPEIASQPPMKMKKEIHLERPGNQVHLMLGFLDVDMGNEDNSAMELVNTTFSGQGGRLYRDLRDKQGLAYSVTSFRRPGLETGVFGLYLACDPVKIGIAKDALFNQLGNLINNGLSFQELEEAKNKLIGGYVLQLQTNGSKAMQMALDELYGMGFDYYRQYINKVKRVSVEDVRRVVKKIINPDLYVMATIGPLN